MSRGCAKLVQEAALRWKREEGNYCDDITAIVARLPFVSSGEASDGTVHVVLCDGSATWTGRLTLISRIVRTCDLQIFTQFFCRNLSRTNLVW